MATLLVESLWDLPLVHLASIHPIHHQDHHHVPKQDIVVLVRVHPRVENYVLV